VFVCVCVCVCAYVRMYVYDSDQSTNSCFIRSMVPRLPCDVPEFVSEAIMNCVESYDINSSPAIAPIFYHPKLPAAR